jgi:hypothetical protein
LSSSPRSTPSSPSFADVVRRMGFVLPKLTPFPPQPSRSLLRGSASVLVSMGHPRAHGRPPPSGRAYSLAARSSKGLLTEGPWATRAPLRSKVVTPLTGG